MKSLFKGLTEIDVTPRLAVVTNLGFFAFIGNDPCNAPLAPICSDRVVAVAVVKPSSLLNSTPPFSPGIIS